MEAGGGVALSDGGRIVIPVTEEDFPCNNDVVDSAIVVGGADSAFAGFSEELPDVELIVGYFFPLIEIRKQNSLQR